MNTTTTTPAAIVGEFATFGIGGDAYPVEIIAVSKSGHQVTARNASVLHGEGSSAWTAHESAKGATFSVAPNENGTIHKFTRKANGKYTLAGGNYGHLALGVVVDRRDSSF